MILTRQEAFNLLALLMGPLSDLRAERATWGMSTDSTIARLCAAIREQGDGTLWPVLHPNDVVGVPSTASIEEAVSE